MQQLTEVPANVTNIKPIKLFSFKLKITQDTKKQQNNFEIKTSLVKIKNNPKMIGNKDIFSKESLLILFFFI